VCCQTPHADDGAGTYTGSGYSGGLDHLSVNRATAAGRCTILELARPLTGERPVALDLPGDWAVQGAADGSCNAEGSLTEPSRFAIGGIGTLSFVDENCTLAVDATLFFLTESGEVEAVRLLAPNVTVAGAVVCR
jgi:hypothetical protein